MSCLKIFNVAITYIYLTNHACLYNLKEYAIIHVRMSKIYDKFQKCFARIAMYLDKMPNTSLYIFTHPKIKSLISNGHISRTWTLLRAHGIRFSHGGFTSQSFSLPSSQITNETDRTESGNISLTRLWKRMKKSVWIGHPNHLCIGEGPAMWAFPDLRPPSAYYGWLCGKYIPNIEICGHSEPVFCWYWP